MTQILRKQSVIAFCLAVLAAVSVVTAQDPPTTQPAEKNPTTAPAGGQTLEGIAVNHLGAGISGATVRIESLDAGEDDDPLATGTTGQNGDIRVQLPRRIEATVRARIIKEGYTTFTQELDLTDADQVPWIDAILEGAGALAGVVRDRLFNEPVKGATVYCQTGGQTFNATTDAEGHYRFNTVAQGPVNLRVLAKGFGVEQRSIRMLSNESEEDFDLGPERKIELKIITDDEKPAPDVRIEAIPLPTNGLVGATTGPDGKASLTGIPEAAERLILRMNGPRYIQMRNYDVKVDLLPDEPEDPAQAKNPPPTSMPAIRRELIIHVAAQLKGTVTDAKTGEPIIGVRVIAGREFRSDAPMAWTTLDGTYELPGLPPGKNVISFQHAQYATAIEEVHLDLEQTATKDQRLNPGQVIGGIVVDSNGEPIEQVFISADDWKGYSTLGLKAVTDKDGKFEFPNAPEGEILFSFVKPGLGQPLEKKLTAGKRDYKIELVVSEPEDNAPPPPPRAPKVEPGKLVPDMTLVALDGTTYKLSQLRGKYVFLDVWATWCGPCMNEVRNVKALRAAMKDRPDFVLIGISLDTDRDALKAALQQHSIDWPQVFGPKSGAREAFEMLNGVAIPSTSLIGPDGTLLAQDLRGPGLTDAVKAAIAKAPTTKPAP